MLTVTKIRGLWERGLEQLSHFSTRHSAMLYLTMLIILPVAVLLAVTLMTALLSLPMALLLAGFEFYASLTQSPFC